VTNKRVLHVDDEPVITFAVRNYLIRQGYDVDSASELEEAQAMLANDRYDIVILDLRLTGSSGTEGFELIDCLRERNPHTPIILLTAHSSPQVERQAVALGASLVLQKPALLPDVADAIRNLLERAP
jgi:DNA-binding response OmpR family regulator